MTAFVLGVALGWPVLAYSKGQWCNDTSEAARVSLTLRRATVGGTDAPPVDARAQFTLVGEPEDRAKAMVRDPDCVDGSASCIDGARERRLRLSR